MQFAAPKGPKPRGSNADHLVRRTVENDLSADHFRIGCKTRPPQRIADDHDIPRPALLLRSKKPASPLWFYTYCSEKIGRDPERAECFGDTGASEIRRFPAIDHCQGGKALVRIAPAKELNRRQPHRGSVRSPVLLCLSDENEPVGIRKRQRPQDYRIDHREHREIPADADTQRECGRKTKHRCGTQVPICASNSIAHWMSPPYFDRVGLGAIYVPARMC